MSIQARRFLCALASGLLALAARAEPTAGVDYRELVSPQPAPPGRIEVIEFFWYRCPHCYKFEPRLEIWAAKLAPDVILKRVPVIFNTEWEIDARIFYALQAIGQEERLRAGLYDAIHLEGGRRLDRRRYQRWVEDWLARQGIDKTRFGAALGSKAVNDQVDRARRMTVAYGVSGTPTLAVNGRYVIGADSGHGRMLATADYLVNRVRREGLDRPLSQFATSMLTARTATSAP